MNAIHAVAQKGFSDEAKSYQRGRPSYPAGVLSWLTNELNIGKYKHAEIGRAHV